MALTELQLPDKAVFYRNITYAATEMNNLMNKWKDLAEFIGFVETVDLDAIGVAGGQVRTDLNNFRTVLDEMISLWEGNSVTPTNNPSEILDRIRMM